LGGEFQNFLNLPVPIWPVVRSGKLPVFVRNFLRGKKRGIIAIGLKKKIFRPAIEVDVRQGFDSFRRGFFCKPDQVVAHAGR